MKYLFLDTNVYLHYKDFEQIDWKTIVCNGDDFTIVIPQIVIREIEKQKDSSKGKIQTRAKKVSSKFGDYFLENKVSDKIKITTCENPSDKDFDDLKFDRGTNDDVLILSAIKSGYNKNDIIVISRDILLLMKAQFNQLKYYKMIDDFLIKEEISEEGKELIATKKELDKYKNRQPKPYVTFLGGQVLLKLSKPKNRDLEMELLEFMKNLKSENPYYIKKGQTCEDPYYQMSFVNIPSIYSGEQIVRFNKELDEYYSEFESFQRFKMKNSILSERFKEIKFEIHNDGTAQTGDMKIFIYFPDNIKLYSKKSKVSMNNIEPVKPSLLGLDRKLAKSLAFNLLTGGGIPQMYCWDEGGNLTDNELRYIDSRINHKLFRDLKIDNSLFVDSAQCGNFNIKWTISDSESIDLIRGNLNVLVQENI